MLGSIRKGAKYILYQSLEVCCTRDVLQRVLDHHGSDCLVVGPVFEGHNFRPGQQILDGRSSPWNTLALWSVRKLALTGFLCIADGLPDVPPSMNREMGPHLHGSDRSRAVLLQLPPHLEAQLSWAANWGKDEARKKWHKYKMASKVARPAAQPGTQEFQKSPSAGSLAGPKKVEKEFAGEASDCFKVLRRRKRPSNDNEEEDVALDQLGPLNTEQDDMDSGRGPIHVGKVLHYGESIMPPHNVKWICLGLCLMFYANSTAVFSTAFRSINNKGPGKLGHQEVAFVALLMGGIYLPMPLSLWLTRTVTMRFGHRYGLLLFLAFLLLGHLITVCGQAIVPHLGWPLVVARVVQGLGSGILFQTRHILAIMSTNDRSLLAGDNHTDIQSWIFFASDLGLAIGALFPWLLFTVTGGALPWETPELIPSAVSLCIELAVMLWVGTTFPSRLIGLPEGVRFTDWTANERRRRTKLAQLLYLWSQVVALSMRDAQWTGNYRQTLAVAAMFLMPLPFEVFASSVSCTCNFRTLRDTATCSCCLTKLVLLVGSHFVSRVSFWSLGIF
eukprot:s166_g33.t2